MPQVAIETWGAFERRRERAGVPAPQRPDSHKWTHFNLDFDHQYDHPLGQAVVPGPPISMKFL